MDGVVPVAIALGSNLGDRRAHLHWAVGRLADALAGMRCSTFHETEPVGVPDRQPSYLNGAVTGLTTRGAEDLVAVLLALEAERGRLRTTPGAARSLDLDLILYGDLVLETHAVVVPHPRFRERRFVLAPLAEIAADWRDPVSGRMVGELLAALDTGA